MKWLNHLKNAKGYLKTEHGSLIGLLSAKTVLEHLCKSLKLGDLNQYRLAEGNSNRVYEFDGAFQYINDVNLTISQLLQNIKKSFISFIGPKANQRENFEFSA